MKIEKFWYQQNAFTILLRPFSWLFRFIVFLRRWAYSVGLKKKTPLPVPVIVVGNITVGGTGKTPLVAWIANTLKSQGYHPGIVSRGFRGTAKQWPQCVTHDSDPVLVGDEPVLLAHRTACPIVVDPDRVSAVQYLLKHYPCNVVISDDGLQHYALARDIEIVVVDGLRRFGNRLCLPAGPLREPLCRLNQVDFIVHTTTSIHLSQNWERSTRAKQVSGEGMLNEFPMQLIPDEIYNVADSSQSLSLEVCREKKWHAIAGIGNPERFFMQLENLGLKIHRHPYQDHYAFSKKDIEYGANNFVIMTEKDAVKCRTFADQRHWYLPVTAELPDAFKNALMARLKCWTPRRIVKNPV